MTGISHSRTRILRTLKIASLVLLVALLIATGATWVRSFSHADRLHGRLWGRGAFLLGSKEGRVVIAGFRSHGHPAWWRWGVHTFPVDDALSFPVGPVRQYERKLGVGWIQNPLYFVMRPEQRRPDGTTVIFFGAATATLQGTALLVPHWLIALVTASSILFLVRGRRFSLRAFLLWVTIVMVILGAAASGDQDREAPKDDGKASPVEWDDDLQVLRSPLP
jgi:hypothetical protein